MGPYRKVLFPTDAEQEMAKTLPLTGGSIAVRSVISRGRTAEEIMALAEEEFVDLVVMGSAAGSITNAVIRATKRPVLAVSSHLEFSTLSGLPDISFGCEGVMQRDYAYNTGLLCTLSSLEKA